MELKEKDELKYQCLVDNQKSILVILLIAETDLENALREKKKKWKMTTFSLAVMIVVIIGIFITVLCLYAL